MVEYVYETHSGWSLILDYRPFFHHQWICDIAARDDTTTWDPKFWMTSDQ